MRTALRPDTWLVSIMQVNNETGVCQPLAAIADGVESHPAWFHTDAAQGFGKDFDPLRHRRLDMISHSGHKNLRPQGIGALIVRRPGYPNFRCGRALLHVSFGPNQDRQIVWMAAAPSGRRVPQVIVRERFLALMRYDNDSFV